MSAHDSYPRRYLAEQRQFARQRQLEEQRQEALAQRLRRAQYLADEDYEYEQPYFACNSLERAYAEEIRRNDLERRKRQEQMRQQMEQRRRADAQAARNYWQSLQDFHNRRQRGAAAGPWLSSSPSVSSTAARTKDSSTRAPTSNLVHTCQPSPSLEVRDEAATKIQTIYRIHRAIAAITKLEECFNSLKHSFTFPSTVDFQGLDGSTITVETPATTSSSPAIPDIPKLAFTPVNFSLHAYIEGLNRLLVKLDAVDSWGNATVRKHRRKVVASVEAEASRVEVLWKQVWATRVEDKFDDSSMSADVAQHRNEEQTAEAFAEDALLRAEEVDDNKETHEFVDVGTIDQVVADGEEGQADTSDEDNRSLISVSEVKEDTQPVCKVMESDQMEVAADEEIDAGKMAAEEVASDQLPEISHAETRDVDEKSIEGQQEGVGKNMRMLVEESVPGTRTSVDVEQDGESFVMV